MSRATHESWSLGLTARICECSQHLGDLDASLCLTGQPSGVGASVSLYELTFWLTLIEPSEFELRQGEFNPKFFT